MKNFKLLAVLLFMAAMTACSGGGEKKVSIMASGKLTVDENDKKNISLEPGTTHNEKEIVFTDDKVTLTVKSPAGNKTFDVNENGHYLLNLKTDTLVGGVIKYGSSGMPTNLSNEMVDHIIDSTQKLMTGQNASDANKTYFIVPMAIKKVSDNSGSKLIGPYNGIPRSVDADASGKTPEMYKFFTNKQKRETLEDLAKQRKGGS